GPTKVPVTISVNLGTGEVELAREDLMQDLEKNIDLYSYGEIIELVDLFEEVPLIFDDEGGIVYSNGLYSPEVVDGETYDSTAEYVYVVKYVDANGQTIEPASDTSSL